MNFWRGQATKNEENDSSTENNNKVTDAKTQSKEELKFSPFIFLPAAIFHQGSRCLIFMALIFTTASSYQILSGSNLIFACIFAKIFLKKVLPWHKWIGVLIIIGKRTWSQINRLSLYETHGWIKPANFQENLRFCLFRLCLSHTWTVELKLRIKF